MANESKLRLLYVLKLLEQYSDEEHPLTTTDLLSMLMEKYGISAHRITLKTDIGTLQSFGIDFDDYVIIPFKCHKIYGFYNPLLTVRDGDKNKYKEGLITRDGAVAVPLEFETIRWCKDNWVLCCKQDECHVFELIVKNK